MPRLPENAPGDGGPGFERIAVQTYAKSLQPQIGREFHVGVTVADHVAACFVDGMRREILLHHADAWLAAGTVLALVMRADAHCLELDALRLEQMQDEPMRALEILPWKRGRPEAVLIRDHDEGKTRGLELEQCRHHSRHETNLFQAVYLFVGRLFVQGAVAIQKEYASSAHLTPTMNSPLNFTMNRPPRSEAGRRCVPGCPPRRAASAAAADGRADRERSYRRPGHCS